MKETFSYGADEYWWISINIVICHFYNLKHIFMVINIIGTEIYQHYLTLAPFYFLGLFKKIEILQRRQVSFSIPHKFRAIQA